MNEHFHELTIAEVRRETDDAVSLRFDLPDELREHFAFRAGQHVTLRAEIDGEELRRNYSVCVSPHDGELRIAIKQITDGRFSSWANRMLASGHAIELMPPHGSFTWVFDPDAARSYLGIAGGSGITPVLSLLKTALIEEPNSRFTLLYGNRHSGSIMFLEELAGLKNRFMDRLAVYHFLEDEFDEEAPLFNGRLDRGKLAEVLGRLVDPRGLDAAFICGPGPMMDAAETALLEAGTSADRILIERFTVDRPTGAAAEAQEAERRAAAGRQLMLTLDGRTRRLTFDSEHGSILDNARAAGLPAPYACKAGVCATCRAKVVLGEVTMAANYGLSAEEVASGYVLTCQAVPKTNEVVLDYDA
ncbi:2Fe-2S iron-sulfur cluster-binding protein [Sphingomonas tabacisoli]|uniref:2Fe-2S iron-sulfur cluster-binding protein n=1 Tax=Sphingomonas tabacisoli TaxID=2249466 RepID=A0ABW4I324_9SPHN